jgi:hypothetical protein
MDAKPGSSPFFIAFVVPTKFNESSFPIEMTMFANVLIPLPVCLQNHLDEGVTRRIDFPHILTF